jgi:hypothetical protein
MRAAFRPEPQAKRRARKEASKAKAAASQVQREHPKLHVTLCACADLPKMDFYGSCDAYVKVIASRF